MIYILFIAGFFLLVKGADLLVEGSSSIAKKNNIPELVIGLTIVSFGTSMPELIVNLMASFNGSAEIAIGNVFGSNIANVLLILGVSAMIKPLPIKKSIYFTEIPMSLVATFMVGFLANANLFSASGPASNLALSRFDGGVLLFFFLLFMAYIFVISRAKPNTQNLAGINEGIAEFSTRKSIIYISLGVIGLFLGGKWIVDGAVFISQSIGLSETFIGLTVIAIGTSLPELVTSAVAAKKGQADLAVGNVIGSNIFNLLWILGISAVIRPLPFDLATNTDIMMVIAASTLLILAVIIGKGPKVVRWEGAVFILVYFAYITYLVMRG